MKDIIQNAVAQAEKEQSAFVDQVPERLPGQGAANAPPAAPVQETIGTLEDVMHSLITRITVVGCGGGGSNTVNRCTQEELGDVGLVAVNTDAQHLLSTPVPHKILIGRHLTRGLGAGSLPQVGEQAAEETEEDLRAALNGSDMVFITCGLGGGTGTGSAPVVAKLAREAGALTIAVCTLPFSVEGAVRMENAEAGLARLRDVCDTVIVIPNDKLLEVAPKLPMGAAFKVADEILVRSIKGITEMITKPGLVNLDFADLKTIMKRGGVAMIGLGESDSQDRARDSVMEALQSPLLDVDITDASGALVNVVGGPDMTLKEAEEVVEEIYARINPDARIIWGTGIDPALDRRIRTMLVITGVRSKQILGPTERRPDQRQADVGIDFVL